MLCPVCLREVEKFVEEEADGAAILTCPHKDCGYNVPLTYRGDYATHPPLTLSLIGLTGHGKTVFKDGFLHQLQALDSWPGFYFNWLDEIDVRNARGALLDLQAGRLPDATRGDTFQPPQILRLSNVPRLGGSQLLIFDTSGEVWLDGALIRSVGKYVRHSKSIVWLLSLADMDSPSALNDMLDIYLHALATMKVNPRDQAIIFTLTKGDLLLDWPDFPEVAREFLFADELDPRNDSWRRLEQVSEALEHWLIRKGYQKVVNTARDRFRAACFCVISAQGTMARNQQMDLSVMPRGVLAPLFWVWRMQRPGIWVEVDGERSLYFSLDEALRSAPDGASIELEPGRHRIRGRIALRRPVHLRGSSADSTILSVEAGKYAIGVNVDGRVIFSNLTLETDSWLPADVVRVVGGQFQASDCCFRNGRTEPAEATMGSGLVVANEAQAVVSRCLFMQNQRHGLIVRDYADIRVEKCKAVHNGLAGFYCESLGQVLLVGNESANNRHGIWTQGQGPFHFEDNHCHDNAKTGIRLEQATGQVKANRVDRNGSFGIQASDSGQPSVVKNQCDGNAVDGMRIEGETAGFFQENSCRGNKSDGIVITDKGRPNLVKNQCQRNGRHGIQTEQTSAPVCRENACADNAGDGIHVEALAEPELVSNYCDGNGGDGIEVIDQAKPVVEENQCHRNGRHGLSLARTSKPKSVKRNIAEGNKSQKDVNDQRPWL